MNIENITKHLYLVVLKILSWRVNCCWDILIGKSLGRCQTLAATRIYQIENDEKFQTERKIADEIMAKILELQLPLKLDLPTEGLGNCFPVANVQQLQRPEIFNQLISNIRYRLTDINSIFRVSDIKYQISSIRYQVSNIKYHIWNIRYRVRDGKYHEYKVSSIRSQVLCLKYQVSSISYQVSDIKY